MKAQLTGNKTLSLQPIQPLIDRNKTWNLADFHYSCCSFKFTEPFSLGHLFSINTQPWSLTTNISDSSSLTSLTINLDHNQNHLSELIDVDRELIRSRLFAAVRVCRENIFPSRIFFFIIGGHKYFPKLSKRQNTRLERASEHKTLAIRASRGAANNKWRYNCHENELTSTLMKHFGSWLIDLTAA